jgi:hypothetical protein
MRTPDHAKDARRTPRTQHCEGVGIRYCFSSGSTEQILVFVKLYHHFEPQGRQKARTQAKSMDKECLRKVILVRNGLSSRAKHVLSTHTHRRRSTVSERAKTKIEEEQRSRLHTAGRTDCERFTQMTATFSFSKARTQGRTQAEPAQAEQKRQHWAGPRADKQNAWERIDGKLVSSLAPGPP